jgi:hypothetical protein
MTLSRRVLWYGKDAALPEARDLRAGPLTISLEEGSIRHVRLGRIEVVRRLYGAVRDRNWNTVPSEFSGLRVDARADSFDAAFDVLCRQGDVDFAWRGAISGTPDGTVTFRFDGEARSTFLRNRIGICVLHPISVRPCRVTHGDGSVEEGSFPRLVSPHQPFKDFRAISHPVAPGCDAELRFDGEVFEMEDQRNWTDGSFKTYSTPLALPFPVEVKRGARILQTVTLSLKGRPPAVAESSDVTLTVEPAGSPFPPIGLGASGVALGPRQIERLRALRLDHLRVDLSDDPVFEREAEAIGARLLRGSEEGKLLTLGDARGTRAYFAELNRSGLRGTRLVYSINPQVHGSDLGTIVETLEGQEESLRSANELAGGRGVVVGPITLKPRFNPNATAAEADPEGTLPSSVDVRQMSLFGAAWTVGSLARLAPGGPAALTYYETTGWRGVMESDAGSALPSIPGGVFPLYHVFADAAGATAARRTRSSHPLEAEIFAFEVHGRLRALAANLTPRTLRVRLAGLPGRLRVRRLNETNAERAMADSEGYRSGGFEPMSGDTLDLLPFETATLDA